MKKLFLKFFFQRRNKNTMPKLVCGFTLVEIVVVIGIMGVLTAIIYSSFDASKAQSRDQKRVSDVSTIQLALEQFFYKNGVYPAQLNLLVPTYLPMIPTDPSNNYNNNYFPLNKTANSPNCISYQLWTTFETGNQYLSSKRGFDSFNKTTSNSEPDGLYYKCDGGSSSGVDAFTDTLVYDVMP